MIQQVKGAAEFPKMGHHTSISVFMNALGLRDLMCDLMSVVTILFEIIIVIFNL